MKELFLSWGMLTLSVIFNAIGVFVVKFKLNDLGPMKFESWKNSWNYLAGFIQSPVTLGGIILFFLSPFLFAVALSRMQIAVAYPAQIGLNFVMVILLALLFLGEKMTLMKALGIIFIMLGVFCLNKSH